MVRLFGFFVGAGLAVAAILLLLGAPEFPASAGAPPALAQEEPAAAPAPEPERPPEPQPEPEPVVAVATPVTPAAVDPRWHAFWSPFGSQVAANGFVSRLEAVTGYDYRVVRVETGVYEVAFAYTSDEERRDKLAAIASATGLELPGS